MIYVTTPIVETPTVVGEDREGLRVLGPAAGSASYGPYEPLALGSWFAGFHIRAVEKPSLPQALLIDVCHAEGSAVLCQRWFGADEFCVDTHGLLGVEFEVTQEIKDYELRLYFAGSGTFEVQNKVVFRTDLL